MTQTVNAPPDPATRYRLLEPVRQYAAEKLRLSRDYPSLQRRHAAYFMRLADAAEPGLSGAEQMHWLALLDREHDNLRAALGWSIAAGAGEQALRMAWGVWRYWQTRGYLAEGRSWVERSLALPGAAGRTAVRAGVLFAAGRFAHAQGDDAAATARFQECLDIGRELDHPSRVTGALTQLALLAARQGDLVRARALHDECLRVRRAVNDRWEIAISLLGLGEVTFAQGDDDGTRAALEEALLLSQEVGDRSLVMNALWALGQLAQQQGDLATASVLLEDSLAGARLLDDRWRIAAALMSLGEVALAEGDAERAHARLCESLSIYQALGMPEGIAGCLEDFAALAAGQGHPTRALRLAGAARTAVGTPPNSRRHAWLERELEPARAALSRQARAAAGTAGQALSREHAILFALSDALDRH